MVLGNRCAENMYGCTPGEIGEPVESLVRTTCGPCFSACGLGGGHAQHPTVRPMAALGAAGLAMQGRQHASVRVSLGPVPTPPAASSCPVTGRLRLLVP
jgi:hypothetical protein